MSQREKVAKQLTTYSNCQTKCSIKSSPMAVMAFDHPPDERGNGDKHHTMSLRLVVY
jgi:hypothetical protein